MLHIMSKVVREGGETSKQDMTRKSVSRKQVIGCESFHHIKGCGTNSESAGVAAGKTQHMLGTMQVHHSDTLHNPSFLDSTILSLSS